MKKTFSKKMIYAVIIILIIAICCTPSSLIGKSVLIRLAVTIPINIYSRSFFILEHHY